MVEKGVLGDAQVELALAEQERSGRPLGEIIVNLGFASPAAVANALAEQHGGPLRTEYGLAAGPLPADGASRLLELPPSGEPAPAVVTAPAPADLVAAGLADSRDGEQPERTVVSAVDAPSATDANSADRHPELEHHERPVRELSAEREQQASALARAQVELVQGRGRLAQVEAELSSSTRKRDELESVLREREAELRQVRLDFEGRLADAGDQLVRCTVERDELLQAVAKLEDELRHARAGLEEKRERDESAGQNQNLVAPESVAQERHSLFFPGASGYSVVEESGPPPAVGDVVRVDRGEDSPTSFVVVKVGCSPLPSFRGRCAFLERA